MSVPMLTPVETPIFDDLVLEQMGEHWDDEIGCEADVPGGCGRAADGRFVILCPHRHFRFGCAEHLEAGMAWMREALECGVVCCAWCGGSRADGAEVVPL